MEVMLEIYKSLDSLGMEWKKKKDIDWPDIGIRPENSAYSSEVEQILDAYTEQTGKEYVMGRSRPEKRAEQNQEKSAQNLFLVETRHRYGNVMVSPTFLRVVIY
jgi:carbon catabolite-derepressing protein kinase